MTSWVYIIKCLNNTYYVGKANNLHYRIGEHSGAISSERHSRYVEAKGFGRIVYFEELGGPQEALKKEHLLKHWHPAPHVRRTLTPIRAYKDYLVDNFPPWKLDAFHETHDDQSLRARLRAGRTDSLPDFSPVEPITWWAERQEELEAAKAAAAAVAAAKSEAYLRDPQQRSFKRIGCVGLIVLWFLIGLLNR